MTTCEGIRFPRFRDINKEQITSDFHIHTCFSDDAQGTVRDVAKNAVNLGLKAIAITDHTWITTQWLREYFNEIEAAKAQYNELCIFTGLEAKPTSIRGERLDTPPWAYDRAEVILFSIHQRLPTNQEDEYVHAKTLSSCEVAEIERTATLNAIDNLPKLNIIAHPTKMYHKIFENRTYPEEVLREIIEKAKEGGVAIELNGKQILEGLYPDFLFELCFEENPLVSFGSDAHSPQELGQGLNEILRLCEALF